MDLGQAGRGDRLSHAPALLVEQMDADTGGRFRELGRRDLVGLVDDRRATSTPGIFAAGDATTVPYKQIIIAMGEGSNASLGAFDYLIRN